MTTDKLYAWLAKDLTGVEGVVAYPSPQGGPLPLVAATESMARRLKPLAALAAQERGQSAYLVAFTRGETIDTTP